MSSMTRLRVRICATCFVLGGATAFLAFTNRGMLVLAVALGVAVVLATWLWRSRPDVFLPAVPGRQPTDQAQPALRRIITPDA